MGSARRERMVKVVGPHPSIIEWVPGEHAFGQLEVIYRREHAHRAFSAIQAVVALGVVDQLHEAQGRALNYGSDYDRRCAYEDFRRAAKLAGWSK